MTPREYLAQGELKAALSAQQEVVEQSPADAANRLFLFELLMLAGRLVEARDQLRSIESDDPDWPRSRKAFARLLRAERRRSHGRKPIFVQEPPAHARLRLAGWHAFRQENYELASARFDRSEARSPAIHGHVDGREFEGLRDSDDRFGAVLEVFVGSEYVWLPLDHVRRLVLSPAQGVLDCALRPGRVTLTDGTVLDVFVPLVYPGSQIEDDRFAIGDDTDWPALDSGLVIGIGAKVLLVGEEELRLSDCTQFDLRVVS
jgi:type VI secretion system protein ImpE